MICQFEILPDELVLRSNTTSFHVPFGFSEPLPKVAKEVLVVELEHVVNKEAHGLKVPEYGAPLVGMDVRPASEKIVFVKLSPEFEELPVLLLNPKRSPLGASR